MLVNIMIENKNGNIIYEKQKKSKSPACALANVLVNEKLLLEDGDTIRISKGG